MAHIHRTVVALLLSAAFAGHCWAQSGIPVLPPPPPVIPVPIPHVAGHSDTQGNSKGRKEWVVPSILAGIGAVAGLILGMAAWINRTVAHLRIVRTPPGEAPESIRRAWVGVKLPLRRWETEPRVHQAVSVLSHNFPETIAGYAVDGRAAVKALACSSPQAAAWWREHAPHVLERGYRFCFPYEVCERVGPYLEGQHNRFAPASEKAANSPGETHSPPLRVQVLGLGVNGLGGLWLREIPIWEEETVELTNYESQAEPFATAGRPREGRFVVL
jgi:hypothetical protein